MAPTLARKLRSKLEIGGAVGTFALLVWFAPQFAAQFRGDEAWNAPALYTGVFGWASIQASFLFAVYIFVLPRTEPFVAAIAATSQFKAFKAYMLRLIYLTLIVAIVAFGVMVVDPKPPASGLGAILFAAWIALCVYSLLGFYKVIRSFRKLDRRRG